MTSHDLTHAQLEPLAEKTREMTDWLHKLQTRLEATGFPADDELMRLTQAAFDRVQHLHVKLHYLNCDAMRRP